MCKKWLLICLALLLSGCVTAQTLEKFSDDELASYRRSHRGEGLLNLEMDRRRKIAVENHQEWKEEIKQAILKGYISIGMTEEQAKTSWGRPDEINTTITSSVKHEQWVYGYYKYYGSGIGYWTPKEYFYFDNGILTSIQN